MKRIIVLVLSLLFLLTAAALADDMFVVNCEEWVSLRKSPSTSAERLKKVPLDAVVTDCEWVDGNFTRCTYQGVTGYILDKYLEPIETGEAETVLDEVMLRGGVDVLAYRQYGEGETLTVTASASDGSELWTVTTGTDYITELTATDVFIGGTADDPRVMLYNGDEGLSCLDLETGSVIWQLPESEVHLGGGLAHAVADDGTMYICGYYGPDPVCVDADGHVRWQSSAGSDDIYWPYEIRVEDRGIVTQYAMMDPDQEGEGRVIYDKSDGHVVDIEYD